MAGIIPGILLTCLFLLAIAIVTRIKPEIGPAGPVSNFKDKIKSLRKAFTMVAIVLATIGGIYSGVFTPVEAAGVGAVLAFCVTLYRKSLDREKMSFVVLQTLQTTATVFMILIGAHVFIPFMALTHIPADMVSFLVNLDVGKTGIIILILVTYIFLGTFLEGLAMLVLTLPVAFEVITQLGMSPIWFGIVVVIVLEMGLISPPVGLNVFVVKSVAQDVSMGTIFRGIWPFWIAMGLCLIILVAFPQIATFLPDRMFDN
jgi:tripartite ATP-independent transporter DctM subunit